MRRYRLAGEYASSAGRDSAEMEFTCTHHIEGIFLILSMDKGWSGMFFLTVTSCVLTSPPFGVPKTNRDDMHRAVMPGGV
jgi:hypothetical protein